MALAQMNSAAAAGFTELSKDRAHEHSVTDVGGTDDKDCGRDEIIVFGDVVTGKLHML